MSFNFLMMCYFSYQVLFPLMSLNINKIPFSLLVFMLYLWDYNLHTSTYLPSLLSYGTTHHCKRQSADSFILLDWHTMLSLIWPYHPNVPLLILNHFSCLSVKFITETNQSYRKESLVSLRCGVVTCTDMQVSENHTSTWSQNWTHGQTVSQTEISYASILLLTG